VLLPEVASGYFLAKPGTDVMILKYFRRKIQQQNWHF
jgi:hypothetical protein